MSIGDKLREHGPHRRAARSFTRRIRPRVPDWLIFERNHVSRYGCSSTWVFRVGHWRSHDQLTPTPSIGHLPPGSHEARAELPGPSYDLEHPQCHPQDPSINRGSGGSKLLRSRSFRNLTSSLKIPLVRSLCPGDTTGFLSRHSQCLFRPTLGQGDQGHSEKALTSTLLSRPRPRPCMEPPSHKDTAGVSTLPCSPGPPPGPRVLLRPGSCCQGGEPSFSSPDLQREKPLAPGRRDSSQGAWPASASAWATAQARDVLLHLSAHLPWLLHSATVSQVHKSLLPVTDPHWSRPMAFGPGGAGASQETRVTRLLESGVPHLDQRPRHRLFQFHLE